MSAVHCFLLVIVMRRGRCAFVKRINDIGAERMLDFNRTLRSKTIKRTVLMRGKRHAFVVDYCELAVRSRDIVVPDGDSWLSWLFRYQHLRDFLPETFAEREHL